MDPKEAETRQKMAALERYIDKQLSGGTEPKSLYHELIERKVPHQLAVDMIDAALKQAAGDTPRPSNQTLVEASQPNRKERIKMYIQSQLDGGNTTDDIINQLVEKKVNRQEAAALVQEVTGDNIQTTMPISGDVSPVLPSAAPIIMPPIHNRGALTSYLSEQLAAGVEMKTLVDELVEHGMERNQAIDLVVGTSEQQKAEVVGPKSEVRKDLRKSARNKLLIGAALFFGGGCFTLASWFSAEVGETYYIFWWPIVAGLITGIAGVVDLIQNR